MLQTFSKHVSINLRLISDPSRPFSDTFPTIFLTSFHVVTSKCIWGRPTSTRAQRRRARSKASKAKSPTPRFACGSLALQNGNGFPLVFQSFFKLLSFMFRLISDLLRPFSDSFPIGFLQVSTFMFSSPTITRDASPSQPSLAQCSVARVA